MLSIVALISTCWCLPVRKEPRESPGVLSLAVRRDLGSVDSGQLSRRSSSPLLNLDNAQTYYTVALDIGTPSTEIKFLIDTGSSDFWVNADKAQSNHYDYEKSSTFKKNDTDTKFEIGFGDHSKASGFWGTDLISVFDRKFEASFGIATENSVTSPILGIGLEQGESLINGVTEDGMLFPTYANFPKLLKENKIIQRIAYSLWLDDAENGNGSLLFGGVDHSKYMGNLTSVPVVNDHSVPVSKNPTSLSVMLHQAKLSGTHSNFESEINRPVLLDTGSTLCQLPSPFVNSLGQALNGNFSEDLQVYLVNCDNPGVVTFNMSGIEIPVKVEDLIVQTQILGGNDTGGKCALGVYKTDSGKFVLGEAFLKNAYTVYDLEGLEIAIARAAPSESQSGSAKVEGIVSKIPRATAATLYHQTHFPDTT